MYVPGQRLAASAAGRGGAGGAEPREGRDTRGSRRGSSARAAGHAARGGVQLGPRPRRGRCTAPTAPLLLRRRCRCCYRRGRSTSTDLILRQLRTAPARPPPSPARAAPCARPPFALSRAPPWILPFLDRVRAGTETQTSSRGRSAAGVQVASPRVPCHPPTQLGCSTPRQCSFD